MKKQNLRYSQPKKSKKDSAMLYLLETLLGKDNIKTCSDELDYFQNELVLDPDGMVEKK